MRSAQLGLRLRERFGFKRAAIAVALKLAVIMHSMLSTDEPLRGTQAPACYPARQRRNARETYCRQLGGLLLRHSLPPLAKRFLSAS
ncbi:hypothetical protein FHT02_003352 [Sphingomonas xinjiangensis]|uniref:Transposase n=1 Tax=Sphingomonas xinjiangensis TaxID=643568 RepID=A0A840YNW2_9SPHN|nr:hypothetical protein [Sphingomonas xinjiangensis]